MPTHIFDREYGKSEANNRRVVLAFCGYTEECDNDGHHSLRYVATPDCCTTCVAEAKKQIAEEWTVVTGHHRIEDAKHRR